LFFQICMASSSVWHLKQSIPYYLPC
jgi:hypothetical protein